MSEVRCIELRKKTVVIGGSGFIGTELCRFLRHNENLVIADVKPPTVLLNGCWRYVDVTDSYSVFEVIKEADYVYHLAANPSPRLAERNPVWDLTINAVGTLNVINACIQHGARMLFTSTLLVKRNGNYGISKLTAERYIQDYVSKRKLDAVIVRLANVYGPSQSLGFVIPDFVQKLTQNPEVLHIRGTGYDTRDFIFVSDVIRALRTVMENGKIGGVYEIGTGRSFTILELAKKMAKLMKLVPTFDTERKGTFPKVVNAANIAPLTELGWKPKITLERGLEQCLQRFDSSVLPSERVPRATEKISLASGKMNKILKPNP